MMQVSRPSNDDDDTACQLETDRAEAEVDVLACVAGWRRGLALLEQLGATSEWFSGRDTRAIYLALVVGHARDHSFTERAKLVRFALEQVHRWDESEARDDLSHMIWGPEALAKLFCRMPYEPDVLKECVWRLLEIRESAQRLGLDGEW